MLTCCKSANSFWFSCSSSTKLVFDISISSNSGIYSCLMTDFIVIGEFTKKCLKNVEDDSMSSSNYHIRLVDGGGIETQEAYKKRARTEQEYKK